MIWLLYLAIAVIIWATLIERFWFAIRRETLAILPKGAKPITILHISDLHMAPWQRRKQNWLANLPVKPDLVINTGDNLGHKNAIDPVLNSLAKFKMPGVFVNGSNDIYAPVIRNPLGYLLRPSERHREQDEGIVGVEGFLHQRHGGHGLWVADHHVCTRRSSRDAGSGSRASDIAAGADCRILGCLC